MLALAPAAFTAHMMAVRIVAPDYTGALGNNQYFAPLHLALFVLAVVVGFGAWHAIGTGRLAPEPAISRSHPCGPVMVAGRWWPVSAAGCRD